MDMPVVSAITYLKKTPSFVLTHTNFSFEHKIHVAKYFLNFPTWKSQRYLKPNTAKTKFLIFVSNPVLECTFSLMSPPSKPQVKTLEN